MCGSLCAGAAIIAYNSYNFTPPRQISDQEYDDNTLAEMQNLYAACLNELDLDVTEVNEAPPIIFHSYSFEGCTYCKIGADECFRTNIYNVAAFLFSANAIHCYQYTYSTTDGTKLKYTNEYFYDDIVSISTGNEIKTINAYQNGMLVNKSIDNQFFSIVTTGGTILTVNLPDKESLESVKAMRSLVKEKKNS